MSGEQELAVKAAKELPRLQGGVAAITQTLRAQAKDYGVPHPDRDYFPSDQARAVARTRHEIAEELETLLLPALSEAELERCAKYVQEQGWTAPTQSSSREQEA